MAINCYICLRPLPVDRHANLWYWKAIKKAKLPSTPTRPTIARRSRFYDENTFLEFVKKDIDIRDMDQHLADFAQSGDIRSPLAEIRESIETGIRQSNFPCDGRLAQIGSFYDGSKTGRLNEMDCMLSVNQVSRSDQLIPMLTSSGFGLEMRK